MRARARERESEQLSVEACFLDSLDCMGQCTKKSISTSRENDIVRMLQICTTCPANSNTGGLTGQDALEDCNCIVGYEPVGNLGSSCGQVIQFRMRRLVAIDIESLLFPLPPSAPRSLSLYLSIDLSSPPPPFLSSSVFSLIPNLPPSLTPSLTAQCAAGKYKAVENRLACSTCPGSSTSPVGSTAQTQCICDAGYTGSSCTACLAGTYKPITGSAACFNCLTITGVSELTTDLTARTSNAACVCQKGYTNQISAGCSTCITGVRARVAQYFYKVTFQTGTTTAEYGGPGGTPVPVDATSFITINNGEYILSVSTQHFTGDWDTYLGCSLTMLTSSGRTIGAGAGASFVGTLATSTDVCGSTITYTASTGKIVSGVSVGYGFCASAPTHMCSVNAGCNAGNLGLLVGGQRCTQFVSGILEVDAPQFCTRCSSGTYKAVTGADVCTFCPDQRKSTSPTASIAISACVCNQGYTGDGTTAGGCSACGAGTYKASIGAAPCSLCTIANKWSAPASISASACQCNAGYDGTGAACVACATGTYKDWIGDDPCTSCPLNSGTGGDTSVSIGRISATGDFNPSSALFLLTDTELIADFCVFLDDGFCAQDADVMPATPNRRRSPPLPRLQVCAHSMTSIFTKSFSTLAMVMGGLFLRHTVAQEAHPPTSHWPRASTLFEQNIVGFKEIGPCTSAAAQFSIPIWVTSSTFAGRA